MKTVSLTGRPGSLKNKCTLSVVHFAKSLQSCRTLCDSVDCSPLVPLCMGFSRQEYWSGLPCSPPGDLPHLRIEPMSLMSPALAGEFFTIHFSIHFTHCLIFLKKYSQGISLAVQWLRLHASSAWGPGLIPSPGSRSHILQLKILYAATNTQGNQ